MSGYWFEFSTIALAHLFAVVSPGPDFALVLKQSVSFGRRTAVWTSIGIGSGISLHIAYSLLGIGLLLRNSPAVFLGVKYLGAAYLAWIGFKSLQAGVRLRHTESYESHSVKRPADGAAWRIGFLTNALNPKVTLFFVSLWTVLISPSTPKVLQCAYGLWLVVATMGWFSLVSFLFTREGPRALFLRYSHWVDRLVGIVFIGFAASLVFARVR